MSNNFFDLEFINREKKVPGTPILRVKLLKQLDKTYITNECASPSELSEQINRMKQELDIIEQKATQRYDKWLGK